MTLTMKRSMPLTQVLACFAIYLAVTLPHIRAENAADHTAEATSVVHQTVAPSESPGFESKRTPYEMAAAAKAYASAMNQPMAASSQSATYNPYVNYKVTYEEDESSNRGSSDNSGAYSKGAPAPYPYMNSFSPYGASAALNAGMYPPTMAVAQKAENEVPVTKENSFNSYEVDSMPQNFKSEASIPPQGYDSKTSNFAADNSFAQNSNYAQQNFVPSNSFVAGGSSNDASFSSGMPTDNTMQTQVVNQNFANGNIQSAHFNPNFAQGFVNQNVPVATVNQNKLMANPVVVAPQMPFSNFGMINPLVAPAMNPLLAGGMMPATVMPVNPLLGHGLMPHPFTQFALTPQAAASNFYKQAALSKQVLAARAAASNQVQTVAPAPTATNNNNNNMIAPNTMAAPLLYNNMALSRIAMGYPGAFNPMIYPSPLFIPTMAPMFPHPFTNGGGKARASSSSSSSNSQSRQQQQQQQQESKVDRDDKEKDDEEMTDDDSLDESDE